MITGTVVAIDPGVSGGVAWKTPGGLVRASKMPEDVVSEIKRIHEEHCIDIVAIEKVNMWSSGKEDEDRGRAMQMQKLFNQQARIVGGLKALDIPVVEVAPMTWQSWCKLRIKNDKRPKTARKKDYKEFAQRQAPHLKVNLNTADAICILAYVKLRDIAEPEYFNQYIKSNHKLF